jgi:integrase
MTIRKLKSTRWVLECQSCGSKFGMKREEELAGRCPRCKAWNHPLKGGELKPIKIETVSRYYQIDYYVGSKRIREVLKGVTDYKDAREIEAKRILNGQGIAQFKRLSELAEWYLTHPDKAHKATLNRDRARYETYLKPFFGDVKIPDITPSLIDDYKVKRQRQKVYDRPAPQPATINQELALLKIMLNFAAKKGKISQVPRIDLLKLDNIRDRFIREDELQKILPHLTPDVKRVILLAYHTGMRLGEILSLRWKHIDWKRNLFIFKGEKTRETRAVALSPEVIEVLQELPKGIRGEIPLFKVSKERCDRTWRKACKKAGVQDARIHDLRKTRATIWHKEKGIPQDLIMHMTGHKTDSMFRRYQIISTEHVERLAQEWARKRMDDAKEEEKK